MRTSCAKPGVTRNPCQPPVVERRVRTLGFGRPPPERDTALVHAPFRRSLLAALAALASSSSAAPSPAPGPQLRSVLGQPDLAAPVRIVNLTWLDGGRELLAGDAGGTVQLWEVARAERRGVAGGGTLMVTPDGLRPALAGHGCLLTGAAAMLSDGRLVQAGRGVLRLCDPSGRGPTSEVAVAGLADDGTALAVSPDGTAAAQGTATGEVLRVALPGGETARVQAHEGAVLALRLTDDGRLFTAGADGAVRTFDGTGRRLRSVEAVPGHRGRSTACSGETAVVAAFAGDGSALLVGTVAGNGFEPCPEVATPARVRLLNLPAGKARWELRGVQASAASFGPAGSLALAVALRPGEPGDANPSTVVRLDPRTGAALDATAGHRSALTVLRFSADGTVLLSGDAAGSWKRWALESGKETATGSGPEGAIVDLRQLADARVLSQHEDDGVRQWRPDGTLLSVLVAPPRPDPVALSPACRAEHERTQGALAAMKPRPSPLPLRDPGRYAGVTLLPELVLSADGETVLVPVAEESCISLSRTSCPSGCQRSYHLERVAVSTGRTVQSLEVDEELLAGCVPPGGAFVTRGERAGMNLWSPTGTLTGRIGVVLGRVSSCETTPDGRRMLVATPRSLSLWDASAFGAPVEAVPRRARAPGPVAFSPRGDLSVDVDGAEVRLRRWPRGTFLARLPLGAHDDAPTAVAFSPDGQTLAVGTARGVIYLYAVGGDGRTAQQAR